MIKFVGRIKWLRRKFRRSFDPGNDPHFIIAGAQKCATTSLHYYLDKHPLLVGSNPKEVRFFNNNENFKLGQSHYKKSFINYENKKGDIKYFEATPGNVYYPEVPLRVNKLYPKLKFIMIFREPVDRAYSAWNMYRDFPIKFGDVPKAISRSSDLYKTLYERTSFPSFEECVNMEFEFHSNKSKQLEPSIVRRGIYEEQLRNYLKYFDESQILVLGFRELIETRNDALNKVLNFLELENIDWSFLGEEKKNIRAYSKTIDSNLQYNLEKFYKPHNQKLFELLGHDLNW